MRGIAALWVVSCHWSGPELTGLARAVALHGNAAVDLFMVLSGFVLAMTYAARQNPPWAGYGRFLWHRFCRLYPLYALTTLACLAEAWLPHGPGLAGGGAALLSNLFMTTTNLWEVDAIDGPSWSISVEFTLNLFLPLFSLLCLAPRRRGAIAVVLGCAAALLATSLLNARLDAGVPGELGTLDTRLLYLRCGPEFALGMLCWRLWRHGACNRRLGGNAAQALLAAALLAMTPFKSLDLAFVAASCLLVIGLATGRGWLAALLAGPGAHWLGTISYSLYLWHAALIPLRNLALPRPGAAALMLANTLGLALVLGLATLSYRYFELPLRQRLRRVVP